MKRGKRGFSMAAAITLLAGSISFPSVSQGAENGLKKFDAQTTVWKRCLAKQQQQRMAISQR
jgi:hypothetical protein